MRDQIFAIITKVKRKDRWICPGDFWWEFFEHVWLHMIPLRRIMYEWVRDLYLEAKERNIEFYFHQCGSMFLRDGENIGKWNLNEQIKRAEEIQHKLEKLHR